MDWTLGPRVEDEPFLTTTEDEHRHWCDSCGGIWAHADSDCQGPRLSRAFIDFACPMCVGD